MKNISRRIKSIRELKNLTQEELADILHLTLGELKGFEDGEIKLTQNDIADFATALEVTVDYLKRGCTKRPNESASVEQSVLENSPITNNSSNTTNNFYGNNENGLAEQLSRIEKKIDRLSEQYDFLIKAGVIHTS